MVYTNLYKANLKYATLHGTDLSEAYLHKTKLQYADLTGDLLDPNAQNRQKAELATDKIRRKFGVNAIIKGRSLR